MGRSLRILHAHSGNIFGGVETILLTLVRHLNAFPGLRMAFALCFEDRLHRDLVEANCEVHSLGTVRVSRPWTVLRARRALRELLHREAFDAVLVHSAWTHAIFAPVARACGKPVIWWLHNSTQGKNWSERLAKWTKPDLMLCVSNSTAATTVNLFREVNKKVIYAPMPTQPPKVTQEERDAIRRELATSPDAVVIIQVSRMEAWKGHADHIRALNAIANLPNWVCWQVGGPHSEEETRYYQGIQRLATHLGLAERVRFLGKRSDVPRLLGAADLFCQPNLDTEGFSIAFIEAFMASIPIITTAIGGGLEIVDDSSGILLPPGRMDLLPESLQKLVVDADLRRKMGAAGHRRVFELCDPVAQIGKIVCAIQDAVDQFRVRR